METNRDNELPQDKDRHLDIPSEANREKHINFLDVESGDDDNNREVDDETKERQQKWREGLEEGKKARNNE